MIEHLQNNLTNELPALPYAKNLIFIQIMNTYKLSYFRENLQFNLFFDSTPEMHSTSKGSERLRKLISSSTTDQCSLGYRTYYCILTRIFVP